MHGPLKCQLDALFPQFISSVNLYMFRNKVRINSASRWFFTHGYYRDVQSTKHKIEVRLYFCPILYIFNSIRLEFGTGDVHNNVLSHSEFRENGRRESLTLVRGIYEFLTALSTLIVRFG